MKGTITLSSLITAAVASVICLILTGIISTSVSPSLNAQSVQTEGEKMITQETLETLKTELIKLHGESNRFRIERGLKQMAQFWTTEDGTVEEFKQFCKENFAGSPEALDTHFKRLEMFFETLNGYYNEIAMDLRQPNELDWGEPHPLDDIFGEFSPRAHLADDLFANKAAFHILLNYPIYSLEEKTQLGNQWNRKDWAFARMAETFLSRIPASIESEVHKCTVQAESYISHYYIRMGQLIDKQFNTYFPPDMRLLSHWNLRDELKSRYLDPKGLFKQQMIYKVMERIVSQDIPKEVIDNPNVLWDPFTNNVYEKGKLITSHPELDTRYQYFLNLFKAQKAMDPFSPFLPTHMKRMFEDDREIPEAQVEALFKELVSSPEVKSVAALIKKRLKRDLYPFDIWYDGFKHSNPVPEEELDKITARKYPNIQAFEAGIPDILIKLGFTEDKAGAVAPKIRVDPARGSGHMMGAEMKSAKSRLRTHATKGGLTYKGFNIAVHELGHAVESTLTLQDMDYYSLRGVPNTAFTEAFAFVFQDRAQEILGFKNNDDQGNHLKALDIFWNAYEIMGVSLVDMKAWNWLYQHPDATPAQLKQAVMDISKEIWNAYYAPIFHVKDQIILGIYSHMIDSSLYLPDYPLGHVIQFQIEKYIENKNIGSEMQRMCASGKIAPQSWMKNAVGSEISVKPLLKAVNEALTIIKK